MRVAAREPAPREYVTLKASERMARWRARHDGPLEAHKVRLKNGQEGWRLELPGQPGGAVLWKDLLSKLP